MLSRLSCLLVTLSESGSDETTSNKRRPVKKLVAFFFASTGAYKCPSGNSRETLEGIFRNSSEASFFETVVLIIILGNSFHPSDSVSESQIRQQARVNGLQPHAVALAIRKLLKRGFIEVERAGSDNWNDHEYTVVSLTHLGSEWLLRNESKLSLDKPKPRGPDLDVEPDDIPF
jgi:DNA-binding MarR family transcriptional regulator